MDKKTTRVAASAYMQLEESGFIHGDLIDIKTSNKKETIKNFRENMRISENNPNLEKIREELLDVAIVINVTKKRYKQQDLDNIAKVVLDALKKPKIDDKLTYFFKDDSQIIRLLLYKIERTELDDAETSQICVSVRKHNPEKEMHMTKL